MYPASVEYLNRQQIIPRLKRRTLGATVDLGFAVCDWLVSDLHVYHSLVFSTCYHWWVCLLVWLLSFFLISFFILIIFYKIFYFNNFLFFSFFLSFSFSLFFWAVWLTGSWCSGRVSGLSLWGGRASSGHWTTRDLLTPCNINWWEISQRSPSQC